MLTWETPWCEPFRAMLTHPRLVPYLNELLGKGFRVDHQPVLLTMNQGAEGFRFHGSSGPGFDPNQYYLFRNNRMHNGLSVVAYQLTDAGPGDGGFAVVPGSHKGNYAAPLALLRYEAYQEQIRQIVCPAGGAIIFTEAVTHGTLPWVAAHQRRSILTRYTAGNMAYVPAPPVPEWADERTRAVLEPPYHTRLNRPVLED
jgi:ectoine hydroxylase-related dioxygenase (phytanoyl-CoA dioxygenase family)